MGNAVKSVILHARKLVVKKIVAVNSEIIKKQPHTK
jgi:ribosomal protein S4